MRLLSVLIAACLLLAACAPRNSSPPGAVVGGPVFRGAFSEYGAAWVVGGRACVARAPEFRVVCPRLGRVVDVAWNGPDAWAAVPDTGLVVTLDLSPRTVQAGAVVALSASRIYREDGSTLTYAGVSGAQVAGAPSRAVTGGDGEDYVLLASEVRRLSDSALVDDPNPVGNDLIATPTGVRRVAVPTALSSTNLYRWQGGQLERLDLAGQVLAARPTATGDSAVGTGLANAGLVGLVGPWVVTVTPQGEVRRYTADLTPLP